MIELARRLIFMRIHEAGTEEKRRVLISLEYRAAICVNVTMMLRRARRTESEVTVNNSTCGKGRAENSATRHGISVAQKKRKEKKKKKNTDVTRDRPERW